VRKTNKVECVRVEVNVPKGIIDFLKEVGVNLDEWLEYTVIDSFRADFDVFRSGADIFIDIEGLIEKHQLRNIPELKSCLNDC